MNILGRAIDERFLTHRLRSTSAGGIAGGTLATLLFAYRYYFDHLWSWDLLAFGHHCGSPLGSLALVFLGLLN